MDTNEWDAVIIGGGIAGWSAAQMLGRARRRTLVIDAGAPRNRFAAHMHGVLGHDGVDPAELLARGRREAAAYGVTAASTEVVAMRDRGSHLDVERRDGAVDTARAVIVATGVRDTLPDVEGLAALWGRSVLHCPYCHGWEVADRRLGVIATSPASAHQIELVRQWSADVTAFTALAEPVDPAVRARWAARGIRVVSTPVVAVVTEGGELTGVKDASGVLHAVDALFTAPSPSLALEFLGDLDLRRTDAPGGPLSVDPVGATSHPRVWAAGNVVSPYGNVPLSMGAGSMAGAAVNAALVAEDADRAVADRTGRRNAHWEQRYADSTQVWSGRTNATTIAAVEQLTASAGETPRTALEIGCGEGADAVWLAEHGWSVTAIDVAPTAIERGRTAAAKRGIAPERLRFVAQDAAGALPEGPFDLVVSSFLHSWEEDFPRIGILRDAAERVAPGGWLLAVSHASAPSWAADEHHEGPVLHTPEEEWRQLALDPDIWTVERAEVRRRSITGPDGNAATLDDGVLLLRRRAEQHSGSRS